MLVAVIVAGLFFILKDFINRKLNQKVEYSVHIQGRTSEDEFMDFTVPLYADETVGKWQEKLAIPNELIEKRRNFTNSRLLELHKAATERAKAEKSAVQSEDNIVQLKK